MINGLRGKIIDRKESEITLNVNNVFYKIFVNPSFLDKVSNIDSKEDVDVMTYLSVRENALDLYGFIDKKDKELFTLLLTISGVGPKSAMNIMNSVTLEMIEEGIRNNDAIYLSKISGVGKKTAEKILLGLKDKIETISTYEATSHKSSSNISEAIEALVSLGYSERDARDSIKNIDSKEKDTQDIIKEALKKLS